MTQWLLALTIGLIVVATAAFIWVAIKLHSHKSPRSNNIDKHDNIEEAAIEDVARIFNDEFREELRNRGRLHFEQIIGENAMFLQQDLRLTTSQLNEFMKAEITRKLTEEFTKYEQSISDAKQLALESIGKTQIAIEEQRQALNQELEVELDQEKVRRIKLYEDNMANIITHYLLDAIGDQIDLNDQLEYIIGQLESNKQAIVEDIKHGS